MKIQKNPSKTLPMRTNVSLKFKGEIKNKNKLRYGETDELMTKSETKCI